MATPDELLALGHADALFSHSQPDAPPTELMLMAPGVFSDRVVCLSPSRRFVLLKGSGWHDVNNIYVVEVLGEAA